MNIAIWFSGFFFLFIIITNISSNFFGYKTTGTVEVKNKLLDINKNQAKFKIGVVLILVEHFGIVFLAISLFIGFSQYNAILGIVWCISRFIEASIQIYDKKNYWNLLDLAIKFSSNEDRENDKIIDSSRNIFKTKEFRFAISQLFFSIGTFAYSILFITYGIIPLFIGWFGIVSSVLYGFGSVIFLMKRDNKALWGIGGLLILIFELILGIWLLWYSTIVP